MRPWLKSASTYTVVRTNRKHVRSCVWSAGRDGSPMRCPLVTIRDTYRDPQRRSNHGRAGKEYKVWLHARGVLVCSGAGRMRRRLRVIPDVTIFQEE